MSPVLRRRSFLSLAALAGLAACSTTEPTPSATASAPLPEPSSGVQTRELEFNRGGDRALPTKVWLPAGNGPFPMIYFSHGLTSQPDDYADLLSFWASAGFVVAGPKYPHTWNQAPEYDADDVVNQPADAQFVITQLLTTLAGTVDPRRIAAAGHSAGAITTVGLFSGSRDERLKAGVLIAGRQMPAPAPFSGSAAPLLFVQGKLDETVTYEQAYGTYNQVTWPKGFLEIPQGTHLPHRDQPQVVAETTTDFWRWIFHNDEAAKGRMPVDASSNNTAHLVSTF